MIGELVDRCVGVFSPGRALERMQARATMQQIAAVTNGGDGYAAGKYNRLTKHRSGREVTENRIPLANLDRLRANSWQLYRDNPHARKIVRTLETKVIGRGLHPHSLATTVDGDPHLDFRKRAAQLWWSLADCIDVRGKPGRGGCDLVEMEKLAFRSCILSGDSLTRTVNVSRQRADRAGSPIRLMLQMIAPSRLSPDEKADGFAEGNQFYRGIELFRDIGERVAYHITTPPLDELATADGIVSRVSAENIVHLYVQEDADQLLGVPWFAPAIFHLQDGGDYQYNVLKASAIGACVIAGYRIAGGQTKLGTNGTAGDTLVDDDGNKVSKMQPGMLLNLGKDGDIKGFNPSQPTTNAEAFIQHILRGAGSAMPGIKASTVTGDYRNSSFSSERSADNDCWPEMESVQDWFATAWCQPIYEEVIRQGFLSGWFSGVVTADEFAEREREYLDTTWSGPMPRSINPKDDAAAARMRIGIGQSSPQLECASIGRDFADVLSDAAEMIAMCKAKGLPEWFVSGLLGQVKPPQEGAPVDADEASQAA